MGQKYDLEILEELCSAQHNLRGRSRIGRFFPSSPQFFSSLTLFSFRWHSSFETVIFWKAVAASRETTLERLLFSLFPSSSRLAAVASATLGQAMKLSISRSWIEPESCMQASSSSSFFSTRDFPFCSRPLTEKKEKKKKGENEQTRAGFSKKRKTTTPLDFLVVLLLPPALWLVFIAAAVEWTAACFYVLKPKFTWWKSDEEHGMSRSFFYFRHKTA